MASIMRAYDIRGLVDKEITEETMYLLGVGFAELISQRSDLTSPIVVGRDGRTTSEKFAEKFMEGLRNKGIDIIDIGLCTTPMLYFAIHSLNSGGGAIITASHCSKELNGIKLNNNKGVNLSPHHEAKPLAEFYKENKDKEFEFSNVEKGKYEKKEIVQDYASFLLNLVNIKKSITVSVDPGNGVGSIPFSALSQKLNINVHPMYMDVDGDFPNHQSDPSQLETLHDLQNKVKETNSDFGVAFDGDADRAGFVDEKGNFIPADIVGCLIADYILEKNPGKCIVHEILCTNAIADLAKEKNAKTTLTKVGRHDLIVEMAKNQDNIFGFEKSGHFFYKEFYGLDSAMLTFLKVAEILSNTDKTFSELLKKYQTYFSTPIISVNIEERDKAIEKIKTSFSDFNISELDGVTVSDDIFKFTVRKSNNDPMLRISIESKTEEKRDEIKDKIMDTLKEFQ
jgi:phosphomannomutase